jgi:hypothetical protein
VNQVNSLHEKARLFGAKHVPALKKTQIAKDLKDNIDGYLKQKISDIDNGLDVLMDILGPCSEQVFGLEIQEQAAAGPESVNPGSASGAPTASSEQITNFTIGSNDNRTENYPSGGKIAPSSEGFARPASDVAHIIKGMLIE